MGPAGEIQPAGPVLIINCERVVIMKKEFLILLCLCFLLSINAWATDFSGYDHYVYDHNDFATDWVEYDPNGMGYDWLSGQPFNDPTTTLGRPTVDTTGDDWYIPEDEPTPVNPVYPAFRYNEIVYLGEGGHITLKFNHPIRDDRNNPYGIDLIVFGNAFQIIGGGQGWTNGDPALITIGPSGFYEPGIVSVSQDGVKWYCFTTDQNFMKGDPNFIKLPDYYKDGPFCDSFAPTLGRVYDPNYPDANLGTWNHWWAEPTNPTFPVDPSLTFADFGGFSVAQMCQVYGNSAGGTGYDISVFEGLPEDPNTGLKWIQYVRVDDKTGGGTAEVDAVSDVSCCGDFKHPYPVGDFTKDCHVNFEDFAVFAVFWMAHLSGPDDPAGIADLYPDGVVDIKDLSVFLNNWLGCNWNCGR